MTIIRDLMSTATAQWIWKNACERLSGRAKYCSVNAWQYLNYADQIANIAPTVSYFCTTHAVEEAVAAFIWSAKAHGYKEVAKCVNVKDHVHKSVVVEFARMVADEAGNAKMEFTLHSEKDDLFARFVGEKGSAIYHLNLGLISFNPDGNDTAPDSAFDAFRSSYLDDKTLVKEIRERAELRNQAIYANEDGVPSIDPAKLKQQLRLNSIIAIGLIWAAMDISRHEDQNIAFVNQVLGAVKHISEMVKRKASPI